MNNIKRSIRENAFNEDKMLSQLYQRAEMDDLRSHWAKAPKEPQMKRKGLLFFGLVAVMLIGILALTTNHLFVDQSKIVAAYVAVDINPSFEMSINKDGTVLDIKAINEDAKTLVISDLIGLKNEEAIESLVERAIEKGLIDSTDLNDDYVLVTTILADSKYSDLEEKLTLRIENRIRNSETLQCVNVVEVKATLADRMEAEGKDVPVGLYVINGMVHLPDGTVMSCGEFFSNEENKLAFKNQGRFIDVSDSKLRERIENAIRRLENENIDCTQLRQRLHDGDRDELLQLQKELRIRLNIENNNQGNNNQSNGNQSNGNQNKNQNNNQGNGQNSKSGNGQQYGQNNQND